MNPKSKRLAQDLYDRIKRKTHPFTLVLGAGASISSDCPNWETMCKRYCTKYHIKVTNEDYSSAFKKAIEEQADNKPSIYSFFADNLDKADPSIGYFHLATLIANGVFKTIITTNFDDLLERTLALIMPINKVKVLIRGEVTDEYIANFIKYGIPQIKIIKLHGDIQSNIFFLQDGERSKMPALLGSTLKDEIERGSIVVGSSVSDLNVLNLFAGQTGYNIFVNPAQPEDKVRNQLRLGAGNDSIQIIKSDFDQFFIDLNLEYQRLVIDKKEKLKEKVEEEILNKQEKGVGYINYNLLGAMIDSFWGKIKAAYCDGLPDIVVFINDPSAPGGMEMKRRMIDRLEKAKPKPVIETILIEGNGVRSMDRKVKSPRPSFKDPLMPKKVLIIDAISFSGNTMDIAIKKYREWFETYSVRGAIMVVDEQLLKIIEDKKSDLYGSLKDLIYYRPTDRHEIFFPWGVTQATKTCYRIMKGLDADYRVKISKRPWGTVEVLAQQQNCSVRILTIEADQKLSFQRHLVRDEFFISLDDNIGLEICAETLEPYIAGDVQDRENNINDIKEIKSLVLEKGEYILIPKGIWHRAKASKERVRLLEIGYGAYDQDHDIERIADLFGRPERDGAV